ncbi:MAG TPA: macro domain-containing protein [Thermoanaerobaculia bacterium]|nr:macro domain-containing protein [Thermoanaerobaculia bacterium]
MQTVAGDLLQQDVEVIVNAWNRNFLPWWLLLPQGVSGAIKRAGGYSPFRELGSHGALPAGAAVATGSGRLPFRAIIHVAGLSAFWTSSEAIVRACVRNALDLARKNGYGSIAFPLIGAGTGGLSPASVEQMMVEEIARSDYDGRVVVVVFAKT